MFKSQTTISTRLAHVATAAALMFTVALGVSQSMDHAATNGTAAVDRH